MDGIKCKVIYFTCLSILVWEVHRADCLLLAVMAVIYFKCHVNCNCFLYRSELITSVKQAFGFIHNLLIHSLVQAYILTFPTTSCRQDDEFVLPSMSTFLKNEKKAIVNSLLYPVNCWAAGTPLSKFSRDNRAKTGENEMETGTLALLDG